MTTHRDDQTTGPIEGVESGCVCVHCLETIPSDARRCPECGGSQRPPGAGARFLKIGSGVALLVSFVVGLNELTSLGARHIADDAAVEKQQAVAEELIRLREYTATWDLLEKTRADERTVATKLLLARYWLLDASTLYSDMTLADISKRLSPIVAKAAASGPPRQKADNLALVARAQNMRARDEAVATDIRGLLVQALAHDESSALAHMLYGHYLMSRELEFDLGMEHLERAVSLERTQPDPSFSVRPWQLAALSNALYWTGLQREEGEALNWQARLGLIRVANELRKEDRPLLAESDATRQELPRAEYNLERVTRAYPLNYPDRLAEIRHALPAEDHLAVLAWLTASDPGGGWWIANSYLSALLYADLGDEQAAIASLQPLAESHTVLTEAADELHIRLTGEPLRSLADRDPWAHRAAVLGRGDTRDKELPQAIDALTNYMHRLRRGQQYKVERVLAIVSTARPAFARSGAGGAEEDTDARDVSHLLSLYEGELLLAAGRPEDARVVLEALEAELPRGHRLRPRTLIELAAALTASAESDVALSVPVRHIRSAVEDEGWSDWAWVRWRPVFEPLHERQDFADFLNRHDRSAGPLVWTRAVDDD